MAGTGNLISTNDCKKKNYFDATDTKNKTRTSKVGAISKAQKAQNILKKLTYIVAKYQISKKLKGDPLEEKKFLNLTMPKKTERGTFGIFQHPFCRKTSKKCKGDPLGEKISEKMSRSAKKI